MNRSIAGIVLAAGKGTRMQSSTPKVLHKLDDKTLLECVIESLLAAEVVDLAIVLGGEVESFYPITNKYPSARICEQKERRGTGDAVASAACAFNQSKQIPYSHSLLLKGDKINAEYCIICAGDTPLLPSDVVSEFINESIALNTPLSVIGMIHPKPFGYGRLVTEGKNLIKIVEEKDATAQIKEINLCNSGVIFAKTTVLFDLLGALTPNNTQSEYYLTDCFEIARKKGLETHVFETTDYEGFQGINTKDQLANAKEWLDSKPLRS